MAAVLSPTSTAQRILAAEVMAGCRIGPRATEAAVGVLTKSGMSQTDATGYVATCSADIEGLYGETARTMARRRNHY